MVVTPNMVGTRDSQVFEGFSVGLAMSVSGAAETLVGVNARAMSGVSTNRVTRQWYGHLSPNTASRTSS